MLAQQETLQFTDYSGLYDKVVPKKHLLRQINDLVDFSFVYKELVSKYCKDNGRKAESPIRLFKYLLLKVIYDSIIRKTKRFAIPERAVYFLKTKRTAGGTPPPQNIFDRLTPVFT